jgi:signal transduction histidine kinase/ActR/RegA family two-component response regulator
MGKKQILYVEDDQALARLVQKRLETDGYAVDLAFDRKQGIKQFQCSSYDVLIVDQTLPEGSGLDLVRIIALTGRLPVTIMVTGTGSEETAVEAMKMGLSDYLVKDLEGGFLNLLPVVIENALHQRVQRNQSIYMERELALRGRIADIFLASTEKEMFGEVLTVLVGSVQSRYGIFGYLDEEGAAVLAGIYTDDINQYNMLGQWPRFPHATWADSPWGLLLSGKTPFITNELFAFPLSCEHVIRSLIVPIVYQGELIGFIGAANKASEYQPDESEMLVNIARYIAPLLDARLKKDRQEKKRCLAEEKLRNLTRKLTIKIKVMKCLRKITELMQNPKLSEDEILQGVVDLTHLGWQYPEITCARIALKGKTFQTVDYRETAWKLSSTIKMDQEVHGTLDVCYLREKPEEEEGLFLMEERRLLEDIAERLGTLIQRKQIERELAQAHRLEAVGQLAAGIAHEINTPTQYVGDNTRFLKDAFGDINKLFDKFQQVLQAAKTGCQTDAMLAELESFARDTDLNFLGAEIPKAIDQSLDGVNRVASIVRAMKEFSHPGSQQKQNIDLAHAVENAVTISRNEWKYVANVVTDFDPKLPLVLCLPSELNQVILNLIVNAAQSIAEKKAKEGGESGTISVRTRLDGDWAELRVEDTGTGIAESVRHQIFNPFFTTKEPGKGSGQGLFIAHNIITKKHDGTIDYQTQIGRGSVFIIRLPIHETEEEMAEEVSGDSASI